MYNFGALKFDTRTNLPGTTEYLEPSEINAIGHIADPIIQHMSTAGQWLEKRLAYMVKPSPLIGPSYLAASIEFQPYTSSSIIRWIEMMEEYNHIMPTGWSPNKRLRNFQETNMEIHAHLFEITSYYFYMLCPPPEPTQMTHLHGSRPRSYVIPKKKLLKHHQRVIHRSMADVGSNT